jgi:hypothetical protein
MAAGQEAFLQGIVKIEGQAVVSAGHDAEFKKVYWRISRVKQGAVVAEVQSGDDEASRRLG